MTALPDPDHQPEPRPRSRKPNRRALDVEPERQARPDLTPPSWVNLKPGALHRRLYGGQPFTRAQAMRQRRDR